MGVCFFLFYLPGDGSRFEIFRALQIPSPIFGRNHPRANPPTIKPKPMFCRVSVFQPIVLWISLRLVVKGIPNPLVNRYPNLLRSKLRDKLCKRPT